MEKKREYQSRLRSEGLRLAEIPVLKASNERRGRNFSRTKTVAREGQTRGPMKFRNQGNSTS